jgi:hypothetical protein
MGRSVSYPRGAIVAYAPTPCDDDYCARCVDAVADCECEPDDQMHIESQTDWDWLKDGLRMRAKALFPSLWEADDWRGREDHTLARNSLVDFGVSEYCGLMAVWIAPRTDLENAGSKYLAARWMAQVTPKFLAEFGEYARLGGLSDGTSVYQKVGA